MKKTRSYYIKKVREEVKSELKDGEPAFDVDDALEFKKVVVEDYPELEDQDEFLDKLWDVYLDEVQNYSLDESVNTIKESNMDKLDKAYKGSYYTITGTGGDINEWKEGYQGLLDKENIGKIKEWIEFTGKDMNNKYGLTGDNAYEPDLHFLAFSLDGLNVGKLATFKIKMQDRWFDDIVDNNASRQGFNPYDSDDTDDEEIDESMKRVKGIKRKQSIKEDLDLDNLITSIRVDIYDDGKAYISQDNSSGSEYDINIKSPKTIVDAFDEYVHDNFGYFDESLKEDLEREFTIFFNREGFEYGSYGAVRVKATNEDEAKEKFYAQNKDDKVTISSIRPTENEDIRKGIRLMENYTRVRKFTLDESLFN